jgi:type I restriction enzyme, S subunit
MASSWDTVRLGDYVDSCLGKMLDAKKNQGTFHPYLGNKQVRWGCFDLGDLAEMKFQDHEHERYGLQAGDLVVCEGGEPGRCALWKGEVSDMKIQKALHRVRAKKGLDNKFLFYWFCYAGKYELLEPYFTGTTIKHLTGKALVELEVPLPPLPEQKAIAHILGALDDKIELNRRMNATLEGMTQALFKSWFVDFDPVIDNILMKNMTEFLEQNQPSSPLLPEGEEPLDAEQSLALWERLGEGAFKGIPDEFLDRAETRRKVYQAKGMALADFPTSGNEFSNVRKLFPDSFQPSELGPIPTGWEVSTVGDEVTAVGGGTPSTKNELFWNGTHPFCTPKDMSKLSSLVLSDTERHLTDSGAKKVSSGILPEGTLLMSSRAPIGYLAIAETPVTVNQGVIALLKNETYQPMFLLSWLRSNMEKIVERANGSTFLEISKKNFKPIPFLKPSVEALSLFNEQAEVIHRKIVNCVNNTNQLTKLRDTLLPKLISGELRIEDAEKMVQGRSFKSRMDR